MTAQLIDGKLIAQEVRDGVAAAVAKRTAAGKPKPTLATVLVGERVDSATYVKNKARLARNWGWVRSAIIFRRISARRNWRN